MVWVGLWFCFDYGVWGVIEMCGGGQRVCRVGRGILRLCDVGCRSLFR